MKIIKKTIKVIAWIAGATILIVYCSGCENNLGANATLDTAISSTLDSIKTYQKANKTDKYKRIDKTKITDGEYWVDEYVTPSGEAGYVVTIIKEIDKIKYQRKINYGAETYRTTDWINITGDATSTDTDIGG
jgi:hypothetical protein